MKNLKRIFAAAAFCAATFVGYNTYKQATMTEEERLIQANIDALSNDNESTGGTYGQSPYPNGDECYVYDNGKQKIGHKSVCYDDTVSRFCTEDICMI